MKFFKPNLKLAAAAGVLYLIISLASSCAPDGDRTKSTVKAEHNGFECEYGDFDQCLEQCEIGNGDSCSNLGIMYVNGVGVKRDEVEAGKLYQKACDLSSPKGCYALYSALVYGVGMPRDSRRAITVADKACSLGHEESCSITKLNRSVQGLSR